MKYFLLRWVEDCMPFHVHYELFFKFIVNGYKKNCHRYENWFGSEKINVESSLK